MLIHQGTSPRRIPRQIIKVSSACCNSKSEGWLSSFAHFLELAPSAALSRLELPPLHLLPLPRPQTRQRSTDEDAPLARDHHAPSPPPPRPRHQRRNARPPLLPLPSISSHQDDAGHHHNPPPGKDQSHRRGCPHHQHHCRTCIQQTAGETFSHGLKHALAWAAAAAAVGHGGVEDSHRTLRSVQEGRGLHRQGGVVRDWVRDEGGWGGGGGRGWGGG